MKNTKFILLLFSITLMSCRTSSIQTQDNFIAIESVKSINDSTYEVNLKCGDNGSVYFYTPYRYEAGDTLWSESQLKKHDNKLVTELKTENQQMKDSAFFYRVSLGNKIQELNIQMKDLQIENNALQKTLVKLK